ncbi:MAG: protein translocase subunit SecD [Coriobacteriales bacterium]
MADEERPKEEGAEKDAMNPETPDNEAVTADDPPESDSEDNSTENEEEEIEADVEPEADVENPGDDEAGEQSESGEDSEGELNGDEPEASESEDEKSGGADSEDTSGEESEEDSEETPEEGSESDEDSEVSDESEEESEGEPEEGSEEESEDGGEPDEESEGESDEESEQSDEGDKEAEPEGEAASESSADKKDKKDKKKDKGKRKERRKNRKRKRQAKHSRFETKKKSSWKKVPVSLLVLLAVICVYSLFMFIPPQEKINQGLDIQGGVSVVMTATTTSGETPTDDQMESAVAVLQNRVNSLGASEATVQRQGTNQILVQIPGIDDPEAALETIGQTGYLEFVNVADITDEETRTLIESGYTGMELQSGTYEAIFDGSNITGVTVGLESEVSSYYAVNLTLDSEGTAAFAEVTQELAPTNGQVAIVLDGVVQSAPAVQSEITNGRVAITGNYTLDAANNLKTILESGSLPVTLTYSQSQVVGPTLGQDSLYAGLVSAIVGMVIVILYLLFYYRGMGTLTAAAMIIFGVLYLGLLATLSAMGLFSLSLSGIAGMVLTIGMAADSSILVIERFREEIRMGRSIKASSISGVKHGILTSIDADIVTMVSALSLFFFASGSVKGFGLTLFLGIICDILTMILFKAPAIRLLAPKVIAKHPKFWGVDEDLEEAVEHGEVQRGGENG